MRKTVALLDESAEMLDRLAALAATDVALDLTRHAAAVRAIRRQVAGPPADQWHLDGADSQDFRGEVGAAD
ncbi:hypothetical protein [Allostella humosa]|nr:hypothetical protein [Stella humosa]